MIPKKCLLEGILLDFSLFLFLPFSTFIFLYLQYGSLGWPEIHNPPCLSLLSATMPHSTYQPWPISPTVPSSALPLSYNQTPGLQLGASTHLLLKWQLCNQCPVNDTR